MSNRLSKYENITEAVASGDQKEILKAQADALAKSIDECESGRDTAALHNRLKDTIAALFAIDPPKAETRAEKTKRIAAEKKAKGKS